MSVVTPSVADGVIVIVLSVSEPDVREKRVHWKEVTVMEKVICENETTAPVTENMSVPESRF